MPEDRKRWGRQIGDWFKSKKRDADVSFRYVRKEWELGDIDNTWPEIFGDRDLGQYSLLPGSWGGDYVSNLGRKAWHSKPLKLFYDKELGDFIEDRYWPSNAGVWQLTLATLGAAVLGPAGAVVGNEAGVYLDDNLAKVVSGRNNIYGWYHDNVQENPRLKENYWNEATGDPADVTLGGDVQKAWNWLSTPFKSKKSHYSRVHEQKMKYWTAKGNPSQYGTLPAEQRYREEQKAYYKYLRDKEDRIYSSGGNGGSSSHGGGAP